VEKENLEACAKTEVVQILWRMEFPLRSLTTAGANYKKKSSHDFRGTQKLSRDDARTRKEGVGVLVSDVKQGPLRLEGRHIESRQSQRSGKRKAVGDWGGYLIRKLGGSNTMSSAITFKTAVAVEVRENRGKKKLQKTVGPLGSGGSRKNGAG